MGSLRKNNSNQLLQEEPQDEEKQHQEHQQRQQQSNATGGLLEEDILGLNLVSNGSMAETIIGAGALKRYERRGMFLKVPPHFDDCSIDLLL